MKLHRHLFLQLVLIFYHPQQRTPGNPIPVLVAMAPAPSTHKAGPSAQSPLIQMGESSHDG